MLLSLQWVQYVNDRGLIGFVHRGFNAAQPAMGLVFVEAREVNVKEVLFQCCLACNGFSMYYTLAQRSKWQEVSMLLSLQWVQYAVVTPPANTSVASFNAAQPAMGLV